MLNSHHNTLMNHALLRSSIGELAELGVAVVYRVLHYHPFLLRRDY